MPNLTYPGVYVQEVASGVRPIEAASTSTPAFVGLAEMGPDDEARRVTSWTEYQRYYGSFIKDGYLAESVFQFFNNGGRQCYVVRVTRSGSDPRHERERDGAEPRTLGRRTGCGSRRGARARGATSLPHDRRRVARPSNEFRITVRRQAEADDRPRELRRHPAAGDP